MSKMQIKDNDDFLYQVLETLGLESEEAMKKVSIEEQMFFFEIIASYFIIDDPDLATADPNHSATYISNYGTFKHRSPEWSIQFTPTVIAHVHMGYSSHDTAVAKLNPSIHENKDLIKLFKALIGFSLSGHLFRRYSYVEKKTILDDRRGWVLTGPMMHATKTEFRSIGYSYSDGKYFMQNYAVLLMYFTQFLKDKNDPRFAHLFNRINTVKLLTTLTQNGKAMERLSKKLFK